MAETKNVFENSYVDVVVVIFAAFVVNLAVSAVFTPPLSPPLKAKEERVGKSPLKMLRSLVFSFI